MTSAARAALLTVVSLAGTALAQSDMAFPQGERVPAWVAVQVSDPDDPRMKAYAAQQKVRVKLEKELSRLRFDYFRTKKTDIRQAGILKLRQYKDPAIFPSLIKLFEREGDDVRTAILDHLADQRSDEADTCIAWGAVFDRDPTYRGAAAERVVRRTREAGNVSTRIQSVIAEGLGRSDSTELASAAQLAQTLKLVEAIPMLINAQIGGSTTVGSGGNGDEHSLAWIEIGTQEAFVADLTPVVGDSAVGFDPTIGVVTEGVVLRVIDAVVITYRLEVHNALVGLSSEAWGRPTASLGWNNDEWRRWYTQDFKPFLAAKKASDTAAARAKGKETPAPTPVVGTPPPKN